MNDPASDPPGETVFVYGSLRRGASQESFMEGAQWLGDGTTLGTLHWVGGQAALVPGKEAGRITGDVFLVNPDHLARLDEMEGGDYRRVMADVALHSPTNGPSDISAWIWEWAAAIDSSEPLQSGDWMVIEHPRPGPLFGCLAGICLLCFPVGVAVGTVMASYGARGVASAGEHLMGEMLAVLGFASPFAGLLACYLGGRRRETARGMRVLIMLGLIVAACLVLLAFAKQAFR